MGQEGSIIWLEPKEKMLGRQPSKDWNPLKESVLNVYAPNNRTVIYVKPKPIELKREIHNYRDSSTSVSIIDRTTRQKIINHIEKLNNTINQDDLTDIYTTLYPIKTE